VAVDMLAVLSA